MILTFFTLECFMWNLPCLNLNLSIVTKRDVIEKSEQKIVENRVDPDETLVPSRHNWIYTIYNIQGIHVTLTTQSKFLTDDILR